MPCKDYCDYGKNECRPPHKPEKHKKHHDCHPHPKTETILKCGTAASIPPITGSVLNGAAGSSNSYGSNVVANVALDTTGLVDPTVKIDFSSLISFRTTDANNYSLRLAFRLSRVCDGNHIPLGTWTFEKTSNEPDAIFVTGEYVQETDSFSFSYCQCETCPGCCYYVVELCEQYPYNISFVDISGVTLSALAVGQKARHY